MPWAVVWGAFCLLCTATPQPAFAQLEFPFSLYETSLPEGRSPRQNFFSVKIQTSEPVHYQMTSLIDSRSQRMFLIDENTGDISTVSEIDREFMSVHYFKVTGVGDDPAGSGTKQTATTTLQISVKDLNDNVPQFESQVYNASVRESLPIGSSIVTVRASDADADDNGRVSYSISGPDAALFRIDPNSGVLTLRGNLDRETKEKHVISVTAQDNAVPASQRLQSNATIIVHLIDDNDNVPAFSRRTYYMDVREDINVGERPSVGRVTAIDQDSGENSVVKYSIIGGNTGGAFAIDPEQGEIYVQKSIDREKQDSYKLIIRAQDLGDPPKSNTTQVVINVLDVNDNDPRFPTSNYYQSVAENVREGYSVLQVTAFDPDQGLNSKIEYSLRDPSPEVPFGVDKTTGWIHTTRPLDREVAGSYRFYVEAKDQGSPRSRSAISTVQISVLDRNDNDPVMSQRSYDIVVSESEPLGSEVLKVVATDPDENSEIRYDIVGGNVAHAFSISSRGGAGIISIAQPLDYNKEKFYRLSVNAVDSGGRFATAAVNINVTDSNNHPPNFENTPYIVDVFEDTPIGSTVLMLFASDLDHGRNAKINYRLQSPSETFHVERDTGALVVSSTIDRESVSTFILTVMAEDSGLSPLSDRTEVEISVVDVNDNAPRFSSAHYHGSIHENTVAGTRILEVSAHDEDLGENGKVRYRFVGENEDEQSFTIDPVSGVIRTKRPLDREAREYYDLMVEAYDAGIPEMTAVVKVGITVLDLNDNPPFFANDTLVFNLPENLPSGSKVGTIYVTDPDIGSNAEVRFKLLNTTADAQYFFIDDSSSSGSTVLYTRKEFDYEVDRREYNLLLRASSDPLRTDAVVLVQLADVNDNYPIIQDFDIIFNQQIDDYYSRPIGYVPASDADPTSKLQYNFTYGNTANLLQLDSSTGAIRLSPTLKSNVNVEARVGVSVSDGKNEARANLRLRLNHITDKMLEQAVTLRIANVTARHFLSPFYDYLIEGLSVVIPCQKSQIFVFSLKDDKEDPAVQVLNVTFSVSIAGTHDEEYLESNYIKQRIYLHSDLLQKLLLLDIMPFDDNICVREPCLNFEQCSSQLRLSSEDTSISTSSQLEPVAGDTLLFRSVDPLLTYHCHCPMGYTGMKNRYTCDTKIDLCYSSPCHQSATCAPRENGYVCLCPAERAGKHCEIDVTQDSACSSSLCHRPATCAPLIDGGLTCRNCSDNPFNDDLCRLRARSFTSDTYAAFPALKQRDEFNITLHFATQHPYGVIFYNGRLNDENDFVALEIRDKALVFRFHTGAINEEPIEVSLTRETGGFSDGHFHRVEVRYTNESATLIVGDNCDEKLALTHGHKLTEKHLCANRTKHERSPTQCGFYSGRCVRLLDLTGPFLLGGGAARQQRGGFVGCMKDLHIDQQLINLDAMVHNNGSVPGCPEKRDFCISSPCRNGGTCINGWGSYQCLCPDDWTGKNCGSPGGRSFGFAAGTELGLRQELSPIQLPWQMGLAIKTTQRSVNFTLLTVKMGNDEIYAIEIRQGIVYYLYDSKVLLTSDLFGVADGKWHDVQLKWMKDEVWMNIDYGQYERTQRSHHSVGGKVVTKVTVGDASDQQNHLIGCVRNIKIGMGDNERPEVAYEKGIKSCKEVCQGKVCEEESQECDDCFCPFKDGKCLTDPCDLKMCDEGSACRSTAQGYECQCPEYEKNDRYCSPKEEKICPSHWWGRPVCGPCQCNVSQGFNESCAIDTGACSCKANHYIKGGKCQPCECYNYGSQSAQCDTETGACKCIPGVSGQKCDKCSHGFAELTSSGCQVIYGVCPAEFSPQGIWWPRSVFGDMPNATCPQSAVGMAKRPCTQNGWGPVDLSGCIHQEFIILSNQVKTNQESWVLIKRARETIEAAEDTYSRRDLFSKDIDAIDACVFRVFENEAKAQGFELAHKKDRHFLENFLSVLSWVLDKRDINATVTLKDVHLISSISVYGKTLATSMESTFTNPFEIVTDSIIFGLDETEPIGQSALVRRQRRDLSTIQRLQHPVASSKAKNTFIPKYNNYIRTARYWSTSEAEILSSENDNVRFHYAIIRTNKSALEREHLLVPRLLWGTSVNMFTDILSVTIGEDHQGLMVNSDITDDSRTKASFGSFIFENTLKGQSNRVHCVLWDRDLWNAIDCETNTEPQPSEKSLLVNCTCTSAHRLKKAIVAVVEESITDGHDYLSSHVDSIVFSVCSSVSLAVLLLTAGCLLMLNSRRKTSIRIHRNIVLCVLGVQLLLLIVILANNQLTAMPFLCTFTTMALHYASVATYVWIAVESVHIYRMLSELRDINHGKTTFYSAAGFGIPGVVVGLTMGVSGNNYGSASFCWLSQTHSSVWGMIGPEAVCALVHIVTMLLNLRTVFKVKTDLEDFATLRLVFFVNACLLPLVTAFHVTALLMVNDRGAVALYTYAVIAVLLALYLMGGFVFCDKFIMRALAQCTGHAKKPSMDSSRTAGGHAGTNVAMSTHHISRSSLSYGHRGKQYNHPNNLDVGAEVSVASTTSQSTYQTSSKFKSSHLDEPDHLHDRYFHGSDSETDIDRRSLDLASSINSSDEDIYDPSDLKHLSVNDYPQY